MADSEGGGKKWLAYGCMGCAGVVVVLLLIVAGVFGTAWVGVKNEQVSERRFEPEIVGPTGEQAKPGRVVLRMNSGQFLVNPARPGESLRVEASFDEQSYELTERFEQDDERWTYEVEFERKGSMAMSLLKMMVGGDGPSIEVFLPLDVPLELVMVIRQAGSEIDLGGLWLTEAEIEFNQGGFALEVSRPLREPMDSLSIRGSMGGFAAAKLGNASPRRLEVESRMGGMDLGLRGEWVTDSEISISTSQGGASVRLPRDVNIVGIEEGRMAPPGQDELPRPTLTFSVSSNRGEIDFIE